MHIYNFTASYGDVIRPDTPLRPIVDDFVAWAREDRPKRLLSEDTLRTYRQELHAFVAFIEEGKSGPAVISDLRPETALAYIKPLRAKKPHRAKNKMIALRALARYLASEALYYIGPAPENGLRARSVLENCPVPQGDNSGEGRRPYTRKQIDFIFEQAKAYRDRPLMHRAVLALAAMQGMRRKEIRRIRFRHVHLPDRPSAVSYVEIKREGTKTLAGVRRFVLEPQVVRLLHAYVRGERPAYRGSEMDDETLFLTRHGLPFTTNGWQTLWQRFGTYVKTKGFDDDFKLHRLRNTWTVDRLRNRIPETIIAAQGGWEHTDMIRRYAKHMPLDVLQEYVGNGARYSV